MGSAHVKTLFEAVKRKEEWRSGDASIVGGHGVIGSNTTNLLSFAALQRPSDVSPSNGKEDISSTGDSACNDVLLYLPDLYGQYGHGNQLHNYILAVLVAAFEGKPLVLLELEPPPEHERWPGGSQFGCRPHDHQTNNATNDGGYPYDNHRGFSRLVDHPAWLSRGCPVPCASTKT